MLNDADADAEASSLIPGSLLLDRLLAQPETFPQTFPAPDHQPEQQLDMDVQQRKASGQELPLLLDAASHVLGMQASLPPACHTDEMEDEAYQKVENIPAAADTEEASAGLDLLCPSRGNNTQDVTQQRNENALVETSSPQAAPEHGGRVEAAGPSRRLCHRNHHASCSLIHTSWKAQLKPSPLPFLSTKNAESMKSGPHPHYHRAPNLPGVDRLFGKRNGLVAPGQRLVR